MDFSRKDIRISTRCIRRQSGRFQVVIALVIFSVIGSRFSSAFTGASSAHIMDILGHTIINNGLVFRNSVSATSLVLVDKQVALRLLGRLFNSSGGSVGGIENIRVGNGSSG